MVSAIAVEIKLTSLYLSVTIKNTLRLSKIFTTKKDGILIGKFMNPGFLEINFNYHLDHLSTSIVNI